MVIVTNDVVRVLNRTRLPFRDRLGVAEVDEVRHESELLELALVGREHMHRGEHRVRLVDHTCENENLAVARRDALVVPRLGVTTVCVHLEEEVRPCEIKVIFGDRRVDERPPIGANVCPSRLEHIASVNVRCSADVLVHVLNQWVGSTVRGCGVCLVGSTVRGCGVCLVGSTVRGCGVCLVGSTTRGCGMC